MNKNHTKYKKLWSNVRDLISSLTKNSYDYDKKYVKINIESDDKLSLIKR